MFTRLRKSQAGSAAIAFILIAAGGSYYVVKNMTSIVGILNKEKQKFNIQYITEKFSQGVFNYTVFAIKERWCMDENWGKDYECGEDMHSIVLNPLNLERLLWSKTALDAIRSNYSKKYEIPIPNNPELKKVKINIPVSKLSTLGESHPLNLALDQRLRRCISEIDIEISKYMITSNLPKGDESLLNISINTKRIDKRECDHIQGDLALNSEVGFYPRTLNQFSVIKAGNLNLKRFKGSDGEYGIRFNGKVYVENNLIISNNIFSPVAFYDTVRVGGGNIYRNKALFSPNTSGNDEDQLYTQLPTLYGFFDGVSLEGELDEGLGPLFGQKFSYPPNTLLNKCITRAKLKDNPFLTKDSRLFIKGSDGNFTLGLSAENEFRDYTFYGQDSDGNYIHSSTKSGQSLATKYNNLNSEDKPVMSITATVSDENNSAETLLAGRSTNVDLNLVNLENFKILKETLSKEGEYIDYDNSKLSSLSNFKGITDHYISLSTMCATLRATYNSSHSKCKTVDKDSDSNDIDCSSTADQVTCDNIVNQVDEEFTKFDNSKKESIDEMNKIESSPPILNIKTSDSYANQVKLRFDIKNESTLNSPLISNLSGLSLEINPFDFAIEDTSNPQEGKRTEESHLPGPNESSNKNIINIEFKKKKSGSFEKAIYRTSDNNEVSKQVKQSGVSGWTIFKKMTSGEPPQVKSSKKNKTLYPESELSTSDARDIDEECNGIFNVDESEWDISFTDNTQFSWLVNVTHSGITISDPSKVKPVPELIFTEDLMRAGNYKGVPNRSIVKTCIVPSNINLVFGFFVCENFVIESRSTHLNIIGTIVTKDLRIPSSAHTGGIDFYPIWHPRALTILKSNGHLKKSNGQSCNFSQPGWSPFLSESTQKDLELCSPMRFVYEGLNNFNWTTIDPEIGIPSDGSSITTHSKIPNRYRRYTSKVLWVTSGVEQ